MNTGLSDIQITEINTVLRNFTTIESAKLFGSRSKGIFKPTSDVDIALIGNNISLQEQIQISALLNESNSFLKYDVLRFTSITNESLRQEIEKHGVVIYIRLPI